MRAVLPGRPPTKLQSFSTALWDGVRVVVSWLSGDPYSLICRPLSEWLTIVAYFLQVYISGHALVILGGPHKLLQTIYVDDADALEAVTIDESSGKIAVCGGPDVFIYQPYGILDETLKVCLPWTATWIGDG